MKIKKDITFGIISILIGLLVWFLIPHQISTTIVVDTNGVGPTFMPKLLCVVMVVLGTSLVIQSLVFKKDSVIVIDFNKEKTVFLYLLIVLLMIIGMDFIGFLPSAILAAICSFLVLSEKNKKYYIIMIVICIAIYAIFKFGLSVPIK